MTGRQQIISSVALHIFEHSPEQTSDLRIWECIEEYVHQAQQVCRDRHVRYRVLPSLKYWDSIEDPDGKAATRLVNEIRRNVEKRVERRNAALLEIGSAAMEVGNA